MDIPCEYAIIDVIDVLGTRKDNITKNINKWQVDAKGVKRNYEGRNMEQRDLLHDVHHDMDELSKNGMVFHSFFEGLSCSSYAIIAQYQTRGCDRLFMTN